MTIRSRTLAALVAALAAGPLLLPGAAEAARSGASPSPATVEVAPAAAADDAIRLAGGYGHGHHKGKRHGYHNGKRHGYHNGYRHGARHGHHKGYRHGYHNGYRHGHRGHGHGYGPSVRLHVGVPYFGFAYRGY